MLETIRNADCFRVMRPITHHLFYYKGALLSFNASGKGLPTREAFSCCSELLLCEHTPPPRSLTFVDSYIPRRPRENIFWIGETDYPLADHSIQYIVESDPVCLLVEQGRTKMLF